MLKQNFWKRTGFITKDFEEAVQWIAILTDENVIFEMAPFKDGLSTVWYVFLTNANTYVCNDLIRDYNFHDEFPVMDRQSFLGGS